MKRLLGTVLGLLCTQVCCVRGAQVEQSPPALSLQEGASSTLRCNFSISVKNVQWFRQHPGGRLIDLFYIPSGEKQSGRLNAMTVMKERRSSLYISSSQTTNSAIYFCAVKPQCFTGTCNLYKIPQLGSASPPTVITSQDHHTVFAQLNIPNPHWSGFNHRHFLALQVWDFGLYLPFPIYISFCTINL
uniref:Ig-like domain-containing protein n=1 Tax=Equus asinus TaxID=9793 RepID=A0A8C4M002_EQUAS